MLMLYPNQLQKPFQTSYTNHGRHRLKTEYVIIDNPVKPVNKSVKPVGE